MEILEKLFGSSARVKLMRLFILNNETIFDSKLISERTRVPKNVIRREMNVLTTVAFVKKRASKGKTIGWVFNPDFQFLSPIKELVMHSDFMKKDEIASRFKQVGKVKLLAVAGIFTQNPKSRLDILLVSDKVKRPLFNHTIRQLESEIGKELSYAIFTTTEFKYRLEMYDKLLSDMLDFPHEKLIAIPEFSTFTLKKT
jgi:hypothetical protein